MGPDEGRKERSITGLTALQVKNAKPGRHADGRGLYLLVREGGSRSWVLRTQVDGKRRDVGLGSTARVSLAQAVELRSRLLNGEEIRPSPAPKAITTTFADAARACHEAIKGGWANKRHSDSWLASLEAYMFPSIGSLPVDQVSSVMVRDALAPIWLKIPESARRVLQRTRTVLDYAHIEGWRPHEASPGGAHVGRSPGFDFALALEISAASVWPRPAGRTSQSKGKRNGDDILCARR